MRKHIPNLITLGNLFCGTIATLFAVQGDFKSAALFVVLGIFFDFFDGFVARLLKVSGELGKQLDSLADMVTSGLVPGIVMYGLLKDVSLEFPSIKFVGLLLTLGACYRLAKFNIDTRQSDSFIGLPTPAMSLFVLSLPLIQEHTTLLFVQNLISNQSLLIIITILLTILMNVELPLFSLKFKSYAFQKNRLKYLFLVFSLGMLFVLKYSSIPLIIGLYVLLSILMNYRSK